MWRRFTYCTGCLPSFATRVGSRQPDPIRFKKKKPSGNPVKLLGVHFDTDLRMSTAVHECVIESSWRLRTLLRTRRFFSHRELLLHFKSHVLSYLEYRTPAIFHATSTVLSPMDRILHNLLHELDIPLDTALFESNLSPLETRRDIAMLGVIHRAVLRSGP